MLGNPPPPITAEKFRVMHSHLHTRREVKTRCDGLSHRWLLKTAWVCSCSCCSCSVHTFSEIMTPYYWVWIKMLKGSIVKGCEKALGMRYPLTLYNWIELACMRLYKHLSAVHIASTSQHGAVVAWRAWIFWPKFEIRTRSSSVCWDMSCPYVVNIHDVPTSNTQCMYDVKLTYS